MLLCDFHRRQAWNRFMKKGENDISVDVAKKLLEDYLIPLSNSATERQYYQLKEKLMESDEWKKNPKFAQYMLQTWLTEDICRVSKKQS